MEAKDPVILKAIREAYNRPDLEEEYISEQDRVVFRAGIREVVEWIPSLIEEIKQEMWADDWGIEHSVIYSDMLDALVKRIVQAKLKEWGV